jgi:hypothetical protein
MEQFPITKSPKPPFNITPEDNIIRSKSEDGAEIARPRYTTIRHKIELTWDATNGEFNALKTFYSANASVPFTLAFSTANGNTEADAGIDFNLVVRFTEPPKFKYEGIGAWEITCTFREV